MNWKKVALLLFSGAGLFSVVSMSSQVGTFRDKKKVFQSKQFWAIAHRGYSGEFPENTMLAFEQAAKFPIDAIELDVHSTRDGKIIVIHDDTLERTTDQTGRVFDRTWEVLRKADAGYYFGEERGYPFRGKGIGLPLLEDVFKAFPDMKFVIEVKQEMPAIEEQVYRLIRKYRMDNKVIVASMHQEPLERFRKIAPNVATNLSGREARQFYNFFRLHLTSFYPPEGDALQIPPTYRGEKIVTPVLAAACKSKGLILHVWTVNEPEDMKRLIEFGVDGIITDYPDRLLQVLSQQQ